MSVLEMMRLIGEKLESGASVKNVYGEPVVAGDRTVIPVARLSYRFGAGGGEGRRNDQQGGGGGGGGMVSATPIGALEITPESTSFTRFTDWRALCTIAAVSVTVGFLIGRRAR
jgi:uncharacterized spore protein YtfJ